MATSSPFRRSRVSILIPSHDIILTLFVVVRKKWSMSEWVSAFLEAEIAAMGQDPEPDDYDAAMPGGDADYGYDDIDSEILESLVILALTAALAFLIYFRGRRQRAAEEERRQQEQRQLLANQVQAMAAQQQAQPQPQPQEDRGMFPHPNDPDFMNWAAGAVGH